MHIKNVGLRSVLNKIKNSNISQSREAFSGAVKSQGAQKTGAQKTGAPTSLAAQGDASQKRKLTSLERKGIQYGRESLSLLETLGAALLSNNVSLLHQKKIDTALENNEKFGNPSLDEIVSLIRQRLAVESAKLKQSANGAKLSR